MRKAFPIVDFFVEDILKLSDDEIMEEAKEKYDDVESEVLKTRNIIDNALKRAKQ